MTNEKPLNLDTALDKWIHRPPARMIAQGLSRTSISPNAVTSLTIIPSGIAAYLFYRANLSAVLLGTVFFYIWSILDHADGELARLTSKCSAFGQKLDDALDIISSTVILWGIFYGMMHFWNAKDAAVLQFIFWIGLALNIIAGVLCLKAKRTAQKNIAASFTGRDTFYLLMGLVISAYLVSSWNWRSFVIGFFLAGLLVTAAISFLSSHTARDN